jgi:ribosomal protein S18 acetylase RimI-like enzyme
MEGGMNAKQDIRIRPIAVDERFENHGLIRAFRDAFCRTERYEQIRALLIQEERCGHQFLGAFTGEEEAMCGFVSWRPWGEPRHQLAELYHLGVKPDSPARGLGRRLVAAMEAAAHEHFRSAGFPGARKIFMLTHATNVRAQNVYRRCGYRCVATLPSFFRQGVDEYVFEKEFPEHVPAE